MRVISVGIFITICSALALPSSSLSRSLAVCFLRLLLPLMLPLHATHLFIIIYWIFVYIRLDYRQHLKNCALMRSVIMMPIYLRPFPFVYPTFFCRNFLTLFLSFAGPFIIFDKCGRIENWNFRKQTVAFYLSTRVFLPMCCIHFVLRVYSFLLCCCSLCWCVVWITLSVYQRAIMANRIELMIHTSICVNPQSEQQQATKNTDQNCNINHLFIYFNVTFTWSWFLLRLLAVVGNNNNANNIDRRRISSSLIAYRQTWVIVLVCRGNMERATTHTHFHKRICTLPKKKPISLCVFIFCIVSLVVRPRKREGGGRERKNWNVSTCVIAHAEIFWPSSQPIASRAAVRAQWP